MKTINPKQNKTFLSVFIFAFILFIFVIFVLNFNNPDKFTGRAILSLDTYYLPNDTLKGNLTISLNKGEFIPAEAVIHFKTGENIYNYSLLQLVNIPKSEGNFYLAEKEISGSGEGFGVKGEKISYPKVNFTFIIKTSDLTDSSDISPQTNNSSESSNNQNNNFSSEGVNVSDSPSSNSNGNSNISNDNPSNSNAPNEQLNPKNNNPDSTELPSNSNANENSNSNSNTPAEQSNSPLTGNVVNELNQQISGVVSEDSPYKYSLENGQTAEIISSSYPISLLIKDGQVIVTTNYSEIEEGFGEEFFSLEEGVNLTINLANIVLPVSEGDLEVILSYQNVELFSVKTNLNLLNPNASVTNKTLTNKSIVNKSQSNELNLSLYELSNEELFKLKALTGANDVKVVKSEIVNDRLVIRFKIGDYWLEKSYDSSLTNETLFNQINLDRVVWTKNLAKKLSEETEKSINVPEYLGNYSFS